MDVISLGTVVRLIPSTLFIFFISDVCSIGTRKRLPLLLSLIITDVSPSNASLDSLHAHLVLLLKKQSLLKLPHHRKGYVAERYMAAYPGFRPMIHRTDLKVALRYAEALFYFP